MLLLTSVFTCKFTCIFTFTCILYGYMYIHIHTYIYRCRHITLYIRNFWVLGFELEWGEAKSIRIEGESTEGRTSSLAACVNIVLHSVEFSYFVFCITCLAHHFGRRNRVSIQRFEAAGLADPSFSPLCFEKVLGRYLLILWDSVTESTIL